MILVYTAKKKSEEEIANAPLLTCEHNSAVIVLLDYPVAIEYLICVCQKITVKIEHSWLCKMLAIKATGCKPTMNKCVDATGRFQTCKPTQNYHPPDYKMGFALKECWTLKIVADLIL